MINDLPNKLRKLTKQLYPTGRAWWMKIGSVYANLHKGLDVSSATALQAIDSLKWSILPDNDLFSKEDALNWERALGLYQQPYLTIEDRKTIILRKMNFPNEVKPRGTRAFIEGELQKAGFDVHVHENRFWNGSVYETVDPRGAAYGEFDYGAENYGQSSISGGYTLIANYVEEAKDANFNIGAESNLKGTFFVGGAIFGERASIDENRKNEFRELILKLKHAQVVGFLQINYVNSNTSAEFTDSTLFEFTDSTNMDFTNL